MYRAIAVLLSTLLFYSPALQAAALLPCRVKTFVSNMRGAENRVCRQSDAGSAHIAVLSVAPWEEYVTSLQPDLSVTPQQALDLALPATATREETVLQSVVATLQAALPTSTRTSTQTEATDTAGVSTTTSETTQASGAGDLADVAAPPAGVTMTPSTNTAAISGTLPHNPSLHRQSALTIYQDAKIISRRLLDSVVPQGFTPYVVSFQVTLLPAARREPYDAYTTVTFLPPKASDAPAASGEVQTVAQQSTVATEGASAKPRPRAWRIDEADGAAVNTTATGGGAATPGLRDVMYVVPLLVTDNIESTRRADTSQQLRDLSASVAALAGNVNLSAGVRRQLNRLIAMQSNDFNSVLTIARLSDNSVRVRLGAIHSSDGYAMIPRTHNITILVVVPDATKNVKYIAKTMLHDAVRGTPLSAGRTGVFGWRYEDVIDPWVRAYQLPSDVGYYVELVPLAQAADYAAFRTHLETRIFPDAQCDSRCKLLSEQEQNAWEAQSDAHWKKQIEIWKKEVALARQEGRRPDIAAPADRQPKCHCDYRGISFSQAFRETAIDRIWADVSNYNGSGQYSEGLFALPRTGPKSRRFFPVVPVTPSDNTRTATTVRVRGGRSVDPTRVRARLRVEKVGGGTFFLEATNVLAKAPDTVELTFPSVWKTLGLKKAAEPATATQPPPPTDERAITSAVLLLSYAPSPYRWQDTDKEFTGGPTPAEVAATVDAGREVEFPAPSFLFDHQVKPLTPGFALSSGSSFILAEKNTGKLKFRISRDKEGAPPKVFFNVKGGDIVNMTPNADAEQQHLVATSDTTYEVELRNLTPRADVVISAFSMRGEERVAVPDVTVAVLEVPEKPSEAKKN